MNGGEEEKSGKIGGDIAKRWGERRNVKRGRRFGGGRQKIGAPKWKGGVQILSGSCTPPPLKNPGHAPDSCSNILSKTPLPPPFPLTINSRSIAFLSQELNMKIVESNLTYKSEQNYTDFFGNIFYRIYFKTKSIIFVSIMNTVAIYQEFFGGWDKY